MTFPDVSTPVSIARPDHTPRAGVPVRLGAFVVGMTLAIVALVMTIGTALLAPLGIVIAGAVQRRRGRTLTILGSWLAGVGSVVIGALALALAISASLPDGSWKRVGREFDAVMAAPAAPPPAWVERVSPGATTRAAATRPPSRAIMIVSMVLGFELFTVMLGTLGWGGAMLLGLAATGRWPGGAASGSGAAGGG